jgi:glucosyl-3-phosphoglycerate synthase
MSDFHQSGPVTALPRLVEGLTPVLEQAIQRHAQLSPVSLVIPMLPGEMDRPALTGILDELVSVSYLESIVVSLNGANAADHARCREFFARYPRRLVVLWSESPGLRRFLADLEQAGLDIGIPGKGRACWLAMGYLLAEGRVHYMAFQDADVVNFRREMLARLILPAVDPTVDFDFVKGYYARVSDRLHGRATRLLLGPLLAAFRRLIGLHPYVTYLSSFRYALSGEFTIKADLAQRMRLACDWGLEIVSLFEALRHRAPGRICQAELAERYDHKHQDLSADDPERGLNRMARDVIKHLLRTLSAAGVTLDDGLLRSLLAAYQREAEDAVADSHAVAVLNGLTFDRHSEEQTVHTFTNALRTSTVEFLADPLGAPLLPNWSRVWAGLPDAGPRLLQAVEDGADGG